MVKSTTASSVSIIFLAACTSELVHQVMGASYDLQVHTCAEISKWFDQVGGVAAKFCTAGGECATSLLAAPLAAGAISTDAFIEDSDYTFTISLGSGVSTMELSVTSNDGWCIDQLSLGPTGGTMEQLVDAPVFLDNPCDVDTSVYSEVACSDALLYDIAPAVTSTTSELYSLTTTTCADFGAYSSAVLSLLACEVDDCHQMLLYELFAEDAPGRVVDGIMNNGETLEWLFWLDAPPTELRLSHFGQLGDADDSWCFSDASFESPVGGTPTVLSSANSWIDAPCLEDTDYEGGCQLEYVFDLTGAAASTSAPTDSAGGGTASTAAPSTQATDVAMTPAPTTTATDAEVPTPAPTASSREVVDSMDETFPPTPEVAMTPVPTITEATDTDESPAPSTSSPDAADSAETVPAPTTDDEDGGNDVTDQDTSSATGRYAPSTAFMASLLVAVVAVFG